MVRLFAAVSVTALVAVFTSVVYAQDKLGNAPKEITNSIGIKLVLIPAGEFLMGTPEGEKEQLAREKSPLLRVQRTQPFFVRKEKEFPQHKVKITRPFYMGKMEVTQEQWKAVKGDNPSLFKGDDLPVEAVSWNDCQEFLKKLSEKEGNTYRLPTEAEWEYACRAGSTTEYCFGDDVTKLGEYAWFDTNNEKKTHPVGQKKPNAWGLYDMHGNVWEWCEDRQGEYPKDAATDPTGAETGERVLRGGGCGGGPSALPDRCRSAFRYSHVPEYRGANGKDCIDGLRVVLDTAPPNLPKEKK